ncbi:MAG: RsmD family RNA methyltransferase [Synergistaceae bacterium]|nr:RsmD family RNA methyltransferase [Synergistaceae bacterium]
MKDVRPTSNKVLLALFNILGDKVIDSKFLDLFSGTGRVGLEAIRHGASSCVFVESVKSRADSIRKQINSDTAIILSLEIRRALSWLVKRGMRFNIIFADPPYNSGWGEVLTSLANLEDIFDDDALLIIEHSIREKINSHNLQIVLIKEYGETCLTFMKKE